MLGAVGGGYVGVIKSQDNTNDMAASLTPEPPDTSAVAGAGREAATDAARAKAETMATLIAQRAKKANDVAKRNQQAAEASRSETRTSSYPVPASCNDYSGNRAIGCALLLEAGFELDQMPCLDRLWTKESGWNHKSQNPSSGAYGIPQALPGDKMAAYGSDWQTNPVPQIKWGLNYIENRYNTPCGAWSFFQANNWY
jgi:hypothetical protein